MTALVSIGRVAKAFGAKRLLDIGALELAPGDLVVLPEGEEGAHKVTNDTEEPVRIAMLSNSEEPSVAFYPDSGKIGLWPAGKLFRLADEVDYFDGEV